MSNVCRALLAACLAGLLSCSPGRAQVEAQVSAEAAERELHAAVDESARAAALAKLTGVFLQLRARKDLPREAARSLVVAVAALADEGTPAAIAFLPAAIEMCERQGFADRLSQLVTQRVFRLATTDPADLLTVGIPALAALEKVPPEHRQWNREGLIACILVEDACRNWQVSAAAIAVAFLARSQESVSAKDAPAGRDLRVLRDSARARLSLLRGEPERTLPDLAAVEAELARAPLADEMADAYLRTLTPLDRVRYQLANDRVEAAIATTDTLLASMTAEDPRYQLLQLANGTALLLHGDLDRAADVLSKLLLTDRLDGNVRCRALERLGRLALLREDDKALDRILTDVGILDGLAIDVRAAILGLCVQAMRRGGAPIDARRALAVQEELRACHLELLALADQQPMEFGGIGFLHFEDAHQVLADLVDATLLAEPGDGVERAFACVLEAQSRGSLSRQLAASGDLAAVRAALAPGGGFLVYVPSRHGSHLFFGDRTTVQHARLASRDAVERAAREFGSSLLGSSDPDALWQSAQTTAALLLPAAARAAIERWSGVVISGTETLGQLPFEALRLADDRLLGEAKAVANQASLPLGVVLTRRRDAMPTPRRLLFVSELAPPAATLTRLGERPGALPQSAIEALQRHFPDSEVTPPPNRSPSALGARDLRDYDVVHLMAHGYSDPSRRFGPGLCLGADATFADGVLWPEEVLQWRVRGLVILSACQAGRAPRRVGEDHGGNLGGAFLFAGAAGVVQSRARLRTDETVALMGVLHERLAAGDRYAEALRAARAARMSAGLVARFHAAQIQLLGP